MFDHLPPLNDTIAGPAWPLDSECAWRDWPVSAVAAHVAGTYHETTRDRLGAIAELLPRVSCSTAGSNPLVAAVTSAVSGLRDAVQSHDWTEDDLLFPVLVALEHPDVLSTRVSSGELATMVDKLARQHGEIRQIIASLDELTGALSIPPGSLSEVEALLKQVRSLSGSLLAEMALEDQCLLARARELASGLD